MAERFVYNTGTISIATGGTTVTGTGTAWSGHDWESAQIWSMPAASPGGVPVKIGTVAAVTPRGVYSNTTLPLVTAYQGPTITNDVFELIDGNAIANGATQAAIFARFNAHLEENMGLTGDLGDTIDYSLVPNNSLFVDPVTKVLWQWRNGVLSALRGTVPNYLDLYDNVGGQSITGSAITVNLDTARADSSGIFTLASDEITCTQDSIVCSLDYRLAVDTPSLAADVSVAAWIELDTGGGYSEVAGSRIHITLTGDGEHTAMGALILTMNSADKVRLRAIRTTGTNLVQTLADYTNFRIFDLWGGAVGPTGPTGGSRNYTYTTATADADPGAGAFRLNNATHASATQIFIDNDDLSGSTVTDWLDSWDDLGTLNQRGYLVLTKQLTPNTFLMYDVSGTITDGTGYRKATIAYIAGSGSFAANDVIEIAFVPSGPAGAQSGRNYTYSSTTADADPGSGIFRLNNATHSSATQAFIDNLDGNADDVSAWLDFFDDVANSGARGILQITKSGDETVWRTYSVTGAVTDGTGYRKVPITYVSGAGTLNDADACLLSFAPAGVDGAGNVNNPMTADLDFNGWLATNFESTGIDDQATGTRLTLTDTELQIGDLVTAGEIFGLSMGGLTTGEAFFSGGSTGALGANIRLFGEAHAADALDILFRASATALLRWDNSQTRWEFEQPVDFGSNAMTNVNIDSGTINGITDLAVADGGTGASTATNARASGNLDAAQGSHDDRWYGFFAGVTANGDYRIIIKLERAGTITETTTRCASGTATATFKVNTTALGGTANSVSSAEQSRSHSTSNTYAAGDDIVITISAASTLTDFSFSIKWNEAWN